jgi:hypothetical protein
MLHNLKSSPDVVKNAESRNMSGAMLVARMRRKRNACK